MGILRRVLRRLESCAARLALVPITLAGLIIVATQYRDA